MSVRFRICLLTWIAVVAISKIASAEEHEFESGWVMQIIPAAKLPAAQPAAADSALAPAPPVESEPVEVHADAASATGPDAEQDPQIVPCPGCGHQAAAAAAAYDRVYRAIPFRRAEYDVNPSYRHDSTMELLTGNARHQTIVRHEDQQEDPTVGPIYPVPYRHRYRLYSPLWYPPYYFPYRNYRGIY